MSLKMTQVCVECQENLYNPFYGVDLVLFDGKRTAFSHERSTICAPDFEKVAPLLREKVEDVGDIGFSVDEMHGTCGGLTGGIQWSYGFTKKMQPKFLDLHNGIRMLPASAFFLLGDKKWIEYSDGKPVDAVWARELYDQNYRSAMVLIRDHMPKPRPFMNEIYIAPEVEDAVEKQGGNMDKLVDKLTKGADNLRIVRRTRA